MVLTDEPERAARSSMNFLWTTFTRFEPAGMVQGVFDQVGERAGQCIQIAAHPRIGQPAGLDLQVGTQLTQARRQSGHGRYRHNRQPKLQPALPNQALCSRQWRS